MSPTVYIAFIAFSCLSWFDMIDIQKVTMCLCGVSVAIPTYIAIKHFRDVIAHSRSIHDMLHCTIPPD